MCGSSIASLDGGAAKTNGIIQIVTCSIFIILTMAGGYIEPAGGYIDPAFYYLFSLAGVFFLLGGVFVLLAGMRRSVATGWIVAALVFAVLNIFSSLSILFTTLGEFFRFASDFPYAKETWTFNKTSLLLFFIFTTFAASALSLAVIWAVVITSRALHFRADARAEVHRNVHVKSTRLKANWIAQAVVTGVQVAFSANSVISAFHEKSSVHGGGALIILACMLSSFPVYILNVYLGFRSARFGENSSLISFLVVNFIQLPLTLWQLYTWFGAMTWELSVRLDISNSIIIISTVVHSFFSIWGIINSSAAVSRDGACGGCCSLGNDDGHAARNAMQLHVAAMVALPRTNGATSTMILVPANAEQMPMNAGQMHFHTGQITINAGEMPIYTGQMTLQTGQLQPGLHNISNVPPPPSYDESSVMNAQNAQNAQIANQTGQIQTGTQNIDSPPPSYENHASAVINAEQIANQTGQIQAGTQNIDSPPPSYDNHAFSVIIE